MSGVINSSAKQFGRWTGATQQAEAAEKAAGVQAEMAQQGMSEQRRQFDKLIELMSPYVGAGRAATAEQLALLGFEEVPIEESTTGQVGGAKIPAGAFSQGGGGKFGNIFSTIESGLAKGKEATGKTPGTKIVASPEAQKRAIAALEQSPFFTSMMQQGENAILQSASATGGLRGGGTQGALAQFRPGLLNQMVQQRMASLGGLTQIGQASAAGQAAQGMQSAGAIGNLLAQQGAAQAGGIMAKGGLTRQVFGDVMGMVSMGSRAMSGRPF